MMIAAGKSAVAFSNEVIDRVKLEFMGAVNDRGQYSEYNFNLGSGSNQITSRTKSITELIVGNNILKSISKLYSEFSSTKKPTVTIQEGYERYIEEIDFQKEISEQVFLQSYAGKFILKCVILDDKLYFETIKPDRYFTIKNIVNSSINDFIVKYSIIEEEKNDVKKLITEIYSEGQTEYRTFEIGDEHIKEIEHYNDLSEYMQKDGLGWIDTYEGWQALEVENLYGSSDYDHDCIVAARELVIGDTLTSQAFDKVANPLLSVPRSLLEFDQNGVGQIRIDDRVVMVDKNDAEVKQIALESKVNEYKVHRDNLLEQIYMATGTNEMAFGLSKDGSGAISGESKRRSLERTLATTEVKRGRVIDAQEKLIDWGIKVLTGTEADIEIEAKEIISLSTSERLAIAGSAFEKGIMSLDEAVRYINLTNSDFEEEIERIKTDLKYKDTITRLMIELSKVVRNEVLNVQLQEQVNELLAEFDL
jgi:predicted HTH domain antitoxin